MQVKTLFHVIAPFLTANRDKFSVTQMLSIVSDLLPEGIPMLTKNWNSQGTFDRYKALAKLIATFEINYVTEIESMKSLMNNTQTLISVSYLAYLNC